jgi:Ca-activated chloride channel family protein
MTHWLLPGIGAVNHFASPWAFWLLLAIPLVAMLRLRRRPSHVTIPTTARLSGVPRGWRVRARWVPPVFGMMAFVLLVIALARPQEASGRQRTSTEGVAIQIVLDRSGSMSEPIDDSEGAADKLSVVKQVVERFVAGDGRSMRGRTGDMIGLIAFARFADTLAPLSRTSGGLIESVKQLTPVRVRAEDGTAIGDALALAAARLKRAEEELARAAPPVAGTKPEFTIKSKVIVLLTDGQNNAGETWPEDAAKLAKEWGIRIYAIAVGGQRFVTMGGLFGDQKMPVGGGADERLLTSLADLTGGKFFEAGDASALEQAYAAIDAMEKTKLETSSYTNVTERFMPFAVGGLALLLAHRVLASAVFGRLP